jgi:hypothetical protein
VAVFPLADAMITIARRSHTGESLPHRTICRNR